MTLLTATALPLPVALSQIGLSTGDMRPETAAAPVEAGFLSVMGYPGLALVLNRRVAPVRTGEPEPLGQPPAADDRAEHTP